jgi:hypothetical protein
MAEQVQTGGLKQFKYDRYNQPELDPERRNAIEIGYAEADERKKKERRNKMIFWVVVGLIVLIIVGYFLLKR